MKERIFLVVFSLVVFFSTFSTLCLWGCFFNWW
jgi:hypothetical protein